jgi:DNA-binding NarL/FixJ family response regulator
MIKTLIVDDSEVFRLSLRRMLATRFRYMRIVEAATLRDAVSLAHTLRVDIVFIDVRLSDGNGLDLPRFIAPVLPETRVCIVTSFDLPEYRAAAREAGACHFLAKGNSTSAEVIDVVNSALSCRVSVTVIDPDPAWRSKVARVLSTHWPVLIVFEARDAKAAVEIAGASPSEVVFARTPWLEEAAPVEIAAIRSANPQALLVAFDDEDTPRRRGVTLPGRPDYTVKSKPSMVEPLEAIMNAALSRRPCLRSCALAPEA